MSNSTFDRTLADFRAQTNALRVVVEALEAANRRAELEQPEPDYLEGDGPCEAMHDGQARGVK